MYEKGTKQFFYYKEIKNTQAISIIPLDNYPDIPYNLSWDEKLNSLHTDEGKAIARVARIT